jgi:hypothetical protein
VYTNAGFDHAEIARQKAQQDRDDKFFEALDRAEKKSEITKDGRQDISPPILDDTIEYDEWGRPVDVHKSTFINDELGMGNGMSHHEMTKRQLAYGNIQPAAYIRSNGRSLGRRFKSVSDEQATADAMACWKCGDATIDRNDDDAINRRWREFQSVFPYYTMPSGFTPKDICLTCGAKLLKRRAA